MTQEEIHKIHMETFPEQYTQDWKESLENLITDYADAAYLEMEENGSRILVEKSKEAVIGYVESLLKEEREKAYEEGRRNVLDVEIARTINEAIEQERNAVLSEVKREYEQKCKHGMSMICAKCGDDFTPVPMTTYKQIEKEFEELQVPIWFNAHNEASMELSKFVLEVQSPFLNQSFIKYLQSEVEWLKTQFQDENPVDCIDGETPVETYGYEATYNQAISDQINYLQAQIKELESIKN